MKSFLSSLRKLDSSNDVLRDRTAFTKQVQALPSLFKNSKVIDKSMRKGIPGISLSLYTSLLTIGTSIGIGITFNPQRSWGGTCVGTYSSRSGVTIDASGAIIPSTTNSVIGYFNSITNSYVPLVNYAGGNNINAIATQPSTGNLFFVNRTTGRTIVYNPNTGTQTTLTGILPTPATIIGATFNASGNLYVYYTNKTLIEVNPSNGSQVGAIITINGIPGGAPATGIPNTTPVGTTLTGGTTNGDIAIGTDGVIRILGDTGVTLVTATTVTYTSRLYTLTISGTTATATPVVASNISGLNGSAANGLAIDPATGNFYISSSLGTYELDPIANTAVQLTNATGTNDLAACGSPAPDLPTITKAFNPNNVVGVPANSTLTLTLGNTNQVPIYLISTLVDNFQTGLAVRSPNGLGGTCLADTANNNKVTAVANSNSISLLNGLKVPAGGCTVTVNVTASNTGTFINTIAAGELKTTAGDNPGSTTGTLVVLPSDYGDAPITGTAPSGTGTNAYGQAIHGVVAGIKLGAVIDSETASIANANASGDGADDDSISSFPTLTAGGTSYSIPAANITATGTGTLHAWIDFNKNGTFDVGEYTSVTVASDTLSGDLNWTGITAGAAGNTFARFRFTSDATVTASTPSGIAADGEVEDYQLSIGAVPITPFRSRINSCGLITFDNNSEGFRAATITDNSTNYDAFTIPPQSAPYANGTRKFEWQSIGNPGGSIFTDDLDGQWTIFTTPDLGTDNNFSFLNSKSLTFDYRSDTGISGTYDFWVALVGKNGQKVFYSFKTQLSGASTTAFSKVVVPMDASKWFTTFQTPGSAAPSSASFATILADLDRIDIGAEGINGPDHTEIDNMGMACDYGDAPDTYRTVISSNGPIHQISSVLKLGNKLDAENDGQPTPSANGDDQDLSASNRIGIVDDEDGISSFPRLTAGAISYSIPAANITATGTGILSAWIDFNKDGLFSATEYASVNVTNGALSSPLNWSGISIGSIGNTFVRLRFTSSVLVDSTATTNIDERSFGVATDGEVEDYMVAITTKAKLLLVKRITAIKRNDQTVPESFATFVDDSSSTTPTSDDNHCNWPGATGSAGACTNTYTVGKTSLPDVQTGDEIEYTIYYLNGGGNPAKQARICDQLDANLTFQTQFDSSNVTTVGKGLALAAGNSSIQYLTNTGVDTDNGQLTTPSSATSCNLGARVGSNLSNNVVVVDVGTTNAPLINSTSAGTPTNSYGYIRFKAKVN